MVTFSFITQGFEVGYGGEGLFAFGETDNHRWEDRDSPTVTPKLRGEVIAWRIDVSPETPWEQYASWREPEQITPRKDKLHAYWADFGMPAGRMQRSLYDAKQVSLSYSLPNDPALAVFLMSALEAGRELAVFCPGFQFIDEDKVAPAPSVTGFEQRGEPAFPNDRPILRLK